MVEEFDVKTLFGKQTFNYLSSNLYPKDSLVFEELISNSIDSKSKKISIEFRKDRIEIEDNGEGMSEEELDSFFSLALSSKGSSSEQKIGKFGFGTISIRRIAKCFEIKTYKDGFVYSGIFDFDKYEKFSDLNDVKTKIKKTKNLDKKNKGTLIIITNLLREFDDNDIKDIQELLSRTLPIEKIKLYINNNLTSPFNYKKAIKVLKIEEFYKLVKAPNNYIDFLFNFQTSELVLNDIEVVFHPKIMEYDEDIRKIIEDENLNPKLKNISGRIYFSEKTIFKQKDFFGISIKVLGRTIIQNVNSIGISYTNVGGSNFTPYRVAGYVNADSLNDIILISRKGFDEEASEFIKFKWYLQKIYEKIARNLYADKLEKEKQEEIERERKEREEKEKEKEKQEMLEKIQKNKQFISSLEILLIFLEKKFSEKIEKKEFDIDDYIKNFKIIEKILLNLDYSKINKFGNEINEKIFFLRFQIYRSRLEGEIKYKHNVSEKIDFYDFDKEVKPNTFLNANIFPNRNKNILDLINSINQLHSDLEQKFLPLVILSRKLFEILTVEILIKRYEDDKDRYMLPNRTRFKKLGKLLDELKKISYDPQNKFNFKIINAEIQDIVKEVESYIEKANKFTHLRFSNPINIDDLNKLKIDSNYENLITLFHSFNKN